MNALMERLYIRGYFSSTIAPLTSVKMTFFLPSREALERIPYQELSALSDQHLANVWYDPLHAKTCRLGFTTGLDSNQSAQL